MKFQSDSRDRRTVYASRKEPPPNYFSRRVQFKILSMVFLFMAVLLLMTEARNPKNYLWMWQLGTPEGPGRGDAPTDAPGAESRSDDVAAADRDILPGLMRDTPESEVVVTAADEPLAAPIVAGAPLGESLRSVQIDGWSYALERLSRPQRRLLRAALWRHRHGRLIGNAQRAELRDVVYRVDRLWSDFHTFAVRSIERDQDQLTDRQKRQCQAVIDASRDAWRQHAASLRTLAAGTSATDEQTSDLAALQSVLDERAFGQIEDNGVLRSAENEAWFRAWEIVQSATGEDLAGAEGPVTYIQLFSQPDEYRGKLVRFRGTARLGYRVPSRNVQHGIHQYNVLLIRPVEGGNSPIVVYTLDLPNGFPGIDERSEAGSGTALDEDIEITGLFFKRWLYLSKGGARLAPLLLGKVTRWEAAVSPEGTASGETTSAAMVIGLLAVTAVFGVAIAVWVYRSSRWSKADYPTSARLPESLPTFGQRNVGANVEQSLRKLEEDERGGGAL